MANIPVPSNPIFTKSGDSVFENVTIWGNTNLTGKVTSTATSNTDSSTTLVTKGYVDKSTLHINVKDFGAKGDGVTDDYASITAAITAAAGQVLVFPTGVYRTSQQIFFKESNSIIRGEGDVTIKNMDGIHGTIGCVGIGNPYEATEAYNGGWKNYPPTTNLILENIKIDYNRSRWFIDIPADAPTIAGRWVSCALSIANAQYITVKNCRITDGKRQSIDITCPAGKYDYPDDSDDGRPGTLIEMIKMPSQPVDVNGDAIFGAQFITIDNCIAEGSGDDVIATHWCSNVLIKNSLFQYTSGKGSSSNTNCIELMMAVATSRLTTALPTTVWVVLRLRVILLSLLLTTSLSATLGSSTVLIHLRTTILTGRKELMVS